jgi:hypothetical protein
MFRLAVSLQSLSTSALSYIFGRVTSNKSIIKPNFNVLQNPHQALQLPSSQYSPMSQAHWHADDNGDWQPYTSVQPHVSSAGPVDPSKIRLLSWNIDFMAPYATERMSAALRYLDRFTAYSTPNTPIVVFLQEMTPPDLKQIREATWVKHNNPD